MPTVSTVLSKLSSTPVITSNSSLPAFLALSAAPLKSPLNTLTTASPKNPIASKADLNLSTILSIMALPKSLIDCNGFSNIDLKESTTPPTLLNIRSKKSLNARDKVSKTVLKKSNTFWFFILI